MRVLFVVGREATYARNEVLLRAFRDFAHVDVVAPDASRAHVFNGALLALRALRLLSGNSYDLVFVGFYGYLIMRLLRPVVSAPLLFDAFVSNFDTLCCDRRWFSSTSIPGRVAFWLDRSTALQADHVLLDTQAHVRYFCQTFGLAPERFSALPVGCNDEIFFPRGEPPGERDVTTVLYYCTYLPLHGVDVVLATADLLRDWPIAFRLIGDGPLHPKMTALAATLRLPRICFLPPAPAPEIAAALHQADIALGGHFGVSAKARHTIPGKLYQMLAAQRPVIAADSPANRELLRHGDAALLTPPNNPVALAGAILHLHLDQAMRRRLAERGRAIYLAQASERVIATQLQAIVQQTMDGRRDRP